MRISKKEKILLLILFIILVGAAYYLFFFQKHNEELALLNEDLESRQLEYDLLNSRLIAANGIEEKILENTNKIVEISEKNYGDLKQENQTVLIKRLARDTGLVINSITYTNEVTNLADLKSGYTTKLLEQISEEITRGNPVDLETLNSVSEEAEGEISSEGESSESGDLNVTSEEEEIAAEEILKNSLVDILKAEIQFTGSYQDLDKYLKNVYDYKKDIIVSDFSFNSDNPGTRQGTLTLSFYGVRDLKHFVNAEQIFKKKSSRGKGGLGFLPYANYVIEKTIAEAENNNTNNNISYNPFENQSNYEPNIINRDDTSRDDNKDSNDTGATEPEEGKRDPNAISLDSFEAFDFFFVGTKGVTGDIHPSTVAAMEKKSAKLSFNFKNPEMKNRAYLVFDKNKKIIYSKSTDIGISYYTEKDLGDNKLGLVLVDSAGTEFELYFDVKSEKGKWKHVQAACKNEFVYPLMVQRLFVEGEGLNQLLNGTIYFDDLRYKAEQAQ